MKDAQSLQRNEAEKADAMFHTAVNHGPSHIGMPGNLVADNDEAQIAVAYDSPVRRAPRRRLR